MNIDNQVIYLERDLSDNSLKYPHNIDNPDQYQIGDLYFTSRTAMPHTKYHIRATLGESVIYDSIHRVRSLGPGLFLFRLFFTSPIQHPFDKIEFIAIRTTEQIFNGALLWLLQETHPNVLDFLEDQYSYNLIGITSISNTE